MAGSTWIVPLQRSDRPRARIICFPFGGGGISVFRGWNAGLERDVEFWAVRLPGRETRAREPFVTDPAVVVEAVGRELQAMPILPTILYGHSLGADLAVELTKWLRQRQLPIPAWLIFSGRLPPHEPYPTEWHEATDDELCVHVRQLGGVPPEVLESEAFRTHFLPLIRADFRLNANLPYVGCAAFDTPISVINGDADRLVRKEAMSGWRRYTNCEYDERWVPGEHFFLLDSPHPIIETLLHACRRVTGAVAPDS